MYITLEEYDSLYDPIEERLFERLAFEACRVVDVHTTGIDNIKKLRRFFPKEESDAQAVKRCTAEIVNFLYQIQQIELCTVEARGAELTDQGLRGKVISSVTAGNESVTYSVNAATSTAIDAAAKDRNVRDRMIVDIIWRYLSGIEDENGVSLLYLGRYPRGRLC